MLSKIASFQLLPNLVINQLAPIVPAPEQAVVGPNLNKRESKKPWAIRRRNETDSVPQDAVILKYEGTTSANRQEDSSGCTYRAKGTLCGLSDIDTAKLEEVKFSPNFGSFKCVTHGHDVDPSYLVFLPDGRVLAVTNEQ